MTYNPNEPQDLPPPVVATTQMRENFSQFQTVFSTNHIPINQSNQGKHTAVIFDQQSSDPGVTSNYTATYAKEVTNTIGTEPQLFLQVPQFLPNEQPNIAQQLTYNQVNTTGAPMYQTFLPGGYVMYFGMVTTPFPVTITLIPTCSKIATVVVMANNRTVAGTPTPMNVYATILGPDSFSINSGTLGQGPPNPTFSWTAIGIQ
jgi:hypothetical protein